MLGLECLYVLSSKGKLQSITLCSRQFNAAFLLDQLKRQSKVGNVR